MFEKNKIAICLLRIVKENIIKNKEPIDNPILLMGLDKAKRFRFFFTIFDKKFNSKYKSFVSYITIEKLDVKRIDEKKLIILENIHEIDGNKNMQEKLHELLNLCFKLNIQIILCSNECIKNLKIEDRIKSKMLYGMSIELNEEDKR